MKKLSTVARIQAEANTIMGRNAKTARAMKDGGFHPNVRKLASIIIKARRKWQESLK